MKKSISLALCLALLLAACGAPAGSTASAPPAASGQSEPASAATSEMEPTELPAAQPERTAYAPFELISPIALSVQGSGNSHGFYQIIINSDMSRNILFMDYASQKQVYLCASPNCEHDSAACTSWIAPAAGVLYPAAAEDHLFILHSNLDDFSYVAMADLDGSNRRTLYTFPSTVEFSTGMAYNGEYLAIFATVLETGDDGSVNRTPGLYAIDVATGECTLIHQFQALSGSVAGEGAVNSFWMGVTDTGFIVKTITNGNTGGAAVSASDKMAGLFADKHTLYELPFDGGDPVQLLSYSAGECHEGVQGAYLYYLQSRAAGHTALKRINTATQQAETVVADFADLGDATCIPDCEFTGLYLMGFVDQYAIIQAHAASTVLENGSVEYVYENYAVDSDTGAVIPLTLGNYYNITQMPLEILAQTKDDLLVYAKAEEYRLPEAGNYYAATMIPGLISKQDYLANNANYRLIDPIP